MCSKILGLVMRVEEIKIFFSNIPSFKCLFCGLKSEMLHIGNYSLKFLVYIETHMHVSCTISKSLPSTVLESYCEGWGNYVYSLTGHGNWGFKSIYLCYILFRVSSFLIPLIDILLPFWNGYSTIRRGDFCYYYRFYLLFYMINPLIWISIQSSYLIWILCYIFLKDLAQCILSVDLEYILHIAIFFGSILLR